MPQICIDPEVIAENGLCYVEQQAAIHGITVGCPEPCVCTPTSCLPTSQIYKDYINVCHEIEPCPSYAPPTDPCELRPWGEWEITVCFNFDHAVRMFVYAHYGQTCNGGAGPCGGLCRRFLLDGFETLPNEKLASSYAGCDNWENEQLNPACLEDGHFVFHNIPAGPHTITFQALKRNTYPDVGCVCNGSMEVEWYREEPCDGYVPTYYAGPCIT